MRDTHLRPAPIDEPAAVAMLQATHAGRLLQGFRGQPARDLQAAAWALMRLSHLMCDLGDDVEEIEINPIIVNEHGAVVVDALVRGRRP